MIFIRENLDNAIHQVLLGHRVLADNNDVKNFRKYDSLVNIIGKSFKVTKSDNIFSDSDSKLTPFSISLFFIFMSG